MIKNKDFRNLLKDGLCQWIRLNLFLLVCMIVIRVIFYFQVHTRIEIEASQFAGIMKGSLFDALLLCRAIAVLAVPFLALYCWFPKTVSRVYMGLVFFYVVVAALLTEYYCNLSMPLDHVILVYTPEEVKGTANSSANITATPFLWFFGTMALVVLLAWCWKRVRVGWVFSAVVLLLSLVMTCCVRYKDLVRNENFYKDHASFCLAVNQPSYSYIKITDHLRDARRSLLDNGEMSPIVQQAVYRYQKLHPEFDYLDPQYPFLRKANDPDVLGGFMEKTDDGLPPNLVFIIIESMGQRLTGVDNPTISFTPFIDSLKQNGLYWKNCLSTSERTFGVLPSIFASAPYGKYGFCVTYMPMPNHRSLLRDLKDNGYGSSYYYGGVHDFDRFDGFLKANKLDYIFIPDMQHVDSATYQYLNEAHRWGLDDRETFRAVMERKKAQPSPRPNIDIIMSLTTHEPFYFSDVKEYEEKVVSMVEKQQGMSAKERNNIMKNLNIFACYLYMDDCVRELMSFYQTLPDYKNTLFVITGDHRMGPLNFGGPLTKYNVPLLFYSPLIVQPRQMSAVVSHLDITPTLNAYLSANYNYHISKDCHWMGTSIDTTVSYRNTHKQAFMLNNRDVVDYVNGDLVLSTNRLFTIGEDFSWDYYENAEKLDAIKSELADFNTVSCYAVQYDYLKPQENNGELLKVSDIRTRQEIGPDDEYGYLFDNFEMVEDFEDIFADISFDLQSMDTTKELPLVVVRLDTYYMALRLNSSDDVSLNTGKPEHYHIHLSIPLEKDCRGKLLKIYLYNKSKTTMQYDNVKIQVSGDRNP